MNIKNILLPAVILLSTLSAEAYVCSGSVVHTAIVNGKKQIASSSSQELKVYGTMDERFRGGIVDTFSFSVGEPVPGLKLIKMSIYGNGIVAPETVSEVIAAAPTSEVEASIVSYVNNGFTRVSINCVAE